MFCDGEVYLTLDHSDMWTAHVPQALAIKALWDQEVQRTKTERIRLEEGCVKLMRELRLSEVQSGIYSFLLLIIFRTSSSFNSNYNSSKRDESLIISIRIIYSNSLPHGILILALT